MLVCVLYLVIVHLTVFSLVCLLPVMFSLSFSVQSVLFSFYPLSVQFVFLHFGLVLSVPLSWFHLLACV